MHSVSHVYLAIKHMKISEITEKEFNDAKQQLLNIPVAIQLSEQLFCSMVGKGFCSYEYENGKCKVEGKCTNHTTK